MKIRLKYTTEELEVLGMSYDINGQFNGFFTKDPATPGGEFFPKEDVAEAPDWAAYRREAAKDILCAILAGNQTDDNDSHFATFAEVARGAVVCADELIEKLKEK